ncbi:MAG: helix-turn-helix domain-containing protein [Patescibacteria group bacterium]|jgi:cytoskeletal protein RodZ
MTPFTKRDVYHGEHVGDTIKTLREDLGWSQIELAERAHVDVRHIQAFEEYRYHDLPGSLYAKNFLRSIAAACNVNTDKLLERFLQDEKAFPFKRSITPPKEVATPIFWTPKKVRAFGIILVLLVALVYVVVELGGLFRPPDLQIFSPQDSIEIHATSVEVTGRVEKGATLTINNAPIGVDDEGNFSTQIDLTPGVNTLTIIATQKFGRKTTEVRNLFAQPFQ